MPSLPASPVSPSTANELRFYHATNAVLREGDVLRAGVTPGMTQPEGEEWRSQRTWLSTDPGNAGVWWGHDDPETKVYLVEPASDVTRHVLTPWDTDVEADHVADQYHAAHARVIRLLSLEEWNDYHRPS